MPDIDTGKLKLLEDYLAEGAVRCPVCKSHDLTSRNGKTDDDYHVREVDCDSCGSSWQDVYRLTYSINLEIGYEQ